MGMEGAGEPDPAGEMAHRRLLVLAVLALEPTAAAAEPGERVREGERKNGEGPREGRGAKHNGVARTPRPRRPPPRDLRTGRRRATRARLGLRAPQGLLLAQEAVAACYSPPRPLHLCAGR